LGKQVNSAGKLLSFERKTIENGLCNIEMVGIGNFRR
jgi:hypothetical protein